MKHTLWNILLDSVLKTPTRALTLPWERSSLSQWKHSGTRRLSSTPKITKHTQDKGRISVMRNNQAFVPGIRWVPFLASAPIFNVKTLKTAGTVERSSTGNRETAMKILTLPFRNHVLFVRGSEPVCTGLACRWVLATR